MRRAEAAQGYPELGGAQEGGPVRDGVEEQEGVGRLQEGLLGPPARRLDQRRTVSLEQGDPPQPP